MDQKDFSNLGEDIKNIVSDAIKSMDFEKLNQDIQKTVKDSLEQAKNGLAAGKEYIQKNTNFSKKPEPKPVNEYKAPAYEKPGSQESKKQEPKYQAPDYPGQLRPQMKQYLTAKPPGSVSGTLYIVFGSIFGSLFGLASIVMLCTALGTGEPALQVLFSIFWLITVLFMVMVDKGKKQNRLIKDYYQYVRFLGDKTYCQLDDLAAYTGQSKKKTLKNVRKMIQKEMFLQGHLDEQETCLMITDECFMQYRDAQNEYRRREKAKKAVKAVAVEAEYQQFQKAAEKTSDKEQPKDSIFQNEEMDQELLAAYSEGKRYLDEIVRINRGISEPIIAQKISRLEIVIRRIFKHVQQHPEQLEEIRRFMEYYLPTTLKLISTYSDFDAQPVQGDNITSAKKEIAKTLDTINDAFTKLLDSLFESAALDISTDISVMNTMLAQEGLVDDNPFSAKT